MLLLGLEVSGLVLVGVHQKTLCSRYWRAELEILRVKDLIDVG